MRRASARAIPMSLRKCSTKNPGSKLPAIIRGPRFHRLHEPAAPVETLWSTLQDRARLETVEQGLADANHIAGDQDLVDHLGVLAEPAGPWCTIVLPIVANNGSRARRRLGLSPPIMIDNLASRAPRRRRRPAHRPNERLWPWRPGQSRSPGQARWSSCPPAPSRLAAGERASSPESHLTHVPGYPTIVKTTSDCLGDLCGDAASLAPFSTKGSAFSAVRL